MSTLMVLSANGAKSAKLVSPKAENAAGDLFQQFLLPKQSDLVGRGETLHTFEIPHY